VVAEQCGRGFSRCWRPNQQVRNVVTPAGVLKSCHNTLVANGRVNWAESRIWHKGERLEVIGPEGIHVPAVKQLLSVAGEGGGIDLVQEENGAGRFRVVMLDHTPTFLDEVEGGPPSRRDSGWLATWEEAIEFFGQWPWPMLLPRYVAPAYVDRVLAAIPEALKRKNLPELRYPAERWLRVCGKAEK